MKESKHTPGPWKFNRLNISGIGEIAAADGRTVARAWDWPEAEANARLIAAAPELLEVLETALRQSSCPGENCAIDWHAQAQVVIAKSKGE